MNQRFAEKTITIAIEVETEVEVHDVRRSNRSNIGVPPVRYS